MNSQLKTISLILLSIFIAKNIFATSINESTFFKGDDLKKQALEVLELKCNVCHKKQNPFMIFKEKNIEKRAPKINQMVFIERKMPKGDKVKLTQTEYDQLKNWLASLSIY